MEHQVFVGEIICKAQGCTTIACFGTAEQSPEFCAAHKLKGMVRLWARPSARLKSMLLTYCVSVSGGCEEQKV